MSNQLQDSKLREFLAYCREVIKYKGQTKIRIYDDHTMSKSMKSMAAFFPEKKEIWVLRGNRIRADWYRSLAHELVHFRQLEDGIVLNGSDGSEHENEANSLAAVILREWGRRDPSIYEAPNTLLTEGYYSNMNIATVADAISRGMLEFDPNNYDTFPSYLRVLSWIKDSSKAVLDRIERLEFDKALYFAKEIQILANDLVQGLEEATDEYKSRDPNKDLNHGTP